MHYDKSKAFNIIGVTSLPCIIIIITLVQHAREKKSLLRKGIPSVSDALQDLRRNPENLRLCEYRAFS